MGDQYAPSPADAEPGLPARGGSLGARCGPPLEYLRSLLWHHRGTLCALDLANGRVRDRPWPGPADPTAQQVAATLHDLAGPAAPPAAPPAPSGEPDDTWVLGKAADAVGEVTVRARCRRGLADCQVTISAAPAS